MDCDISNASNFLASKSHLLMTLKWNGLTQSEPLELESIVRQCFSNPGRSRFPEFLNQRGWRNKSIFFDENQDPELWMQKMKPGLIKSFNSLKIFLDDSTIFNPNSSHRKPFLEAIKSSRWHGPYKGNSGDLFHFVSINQSGDNEYFVCLELCLQSSVNDYLLFYKNCSHIAN